MFNHDLKLFLRNLVRYRLNSTIIILSLTIGFACTTLLVSFLSNEIQTDANHKELDKKFQVFTNDPFAGQGSIAFISNYFSSYLSDNYPGVQAVCGVGNVDKALLTVSVGTFTDLLVLSVDSTFFNLFNFPVTNGSVEKALAPGSIVLTQEKAEVLFGSRDPIGKSIVIATPDTTKTFTVSAVVDDKLKSHLKFDVLIHHSAFKYDGGAVYVSLREQSLAEGLALKIKEDPRRPGLLGEGSMMYDFRPLKNSYFDVDNRQPYQKTRSVLFLKICGTVCALIFFIASFNFINLYLLGLKARRKESGIRKTLGASFQESLKSSFLEVFMFIMISFIFSLLLTYFLLPEFNTLLGAGLQVKNIGSIEISLVLSLTILVLVMVTVFLSGLHQNNTPSISLMKHTTGTSVSFSKPFFLVQFVISVTLIICSVTLYRQMNFLENEPLGFNRSLIQLQAPSKNLSVQLPLLKTELVAQAGVRNVTVCSGNPISGNSIVRYELGNNEFYTPYLFSGDADLVNTMKLTLVQGVSPASTQQGKLVNEAFVRFFNLKDPVGEIIPGTSDKIAGVVKDFTCSSFKVQIPPVIISTVESSTRLLIDYSGAEVNAVLPDIEKSWKKIFPEHWFSYQIIDHDLADKYKQERFFFKLGIVSAMVSMTISCFGLFALSWATVQSRLREIGIRKVLGATANDIVALLSINFVRRIAIALAIAIPSGYLLMEKWLENFANKIVLDIWIFLYSAFIVMLISILTLSFQTIKGAFVNPVDELKSE